MNGVWEKIYQLIMQVLQELLKVKEPERPNMPAAFSIPEIVVVKGVKVKTQGHYKTKTGNAKGLIVHYTVSGRTATSAQSVLRYLAGQGLGCMVMDENGVIYVAENVNLQKSVAWHAGSSSIYGTTGLSQYCMGMEICNWGRLTNESKPKAKETRTVIAKTANIQPGTYEAYTAAQEESLVNFCLWQKQVNPEFDLDWVLGHDEVAPTRKADPGASLSMTMPEFRRHLKTASLVKY